MCMYCKNDKYKESTTTHVVNYKNCIIVVKNVPCLECEQCGEKYYSDAVVEKLERIVESVKKLMQEIAVVDYAMTA
ncbi:YgiT-type zinc finger domain-containing protein [Ruminococcaceae bacterium FB2012]|nr:YgiT-type zinc finger domain-containing protein [Ruminococcaceae bacterium FB2012]